jgi:hypothetical protein
VLRSAELLPAAAAAALLLLLPLLPLPLPLPLLLLCCEGGLQHTEGEGPRSCLSKQYV